MEPFDDNVVFHAKGPKKPAPKIVLRADSSTDILVLKDLYIAHDLFPRGCIQSIKEVQIDEAPVLAKLRTIPEPVFKRLLKSSSDARDTAQRAFCLALLLGHLQVCRHFQRLGLIPRDVSCSERELATVPKSIIASSTKLSSVSLAALSGKLPVMQYVLSLNLPVTTPDKLGFTPALIAAVTGDIAMLALLRDRVSLSLAVGTTSVVWALQSLIRPPPTVDPYRQPLILSLHYPSEISVSLCLSPLMAAIFGSQIPTFNYLVDEVKVDVNVSEKHKGSTAAHVCALAGSKWEPAITHCLRKLIECNAEMDCVDNYGATVFNYVPPSLREVVAEYYNKHQHNAMQVILRALEPSPIPVGPLMDIVTDYLSFGTIEWGNFHSRPSHWDRFQ